ncbi:bifunctional UDP-N-acetylglucosamine diphosphorylase/glucosamine-1-phosphate N-acetyltransferase GlmU [Halarcobacter anaerophilus]|uniref:Bifunctional protein GlmU n=1 Tax=Halarcobacter anaerophilus TaxID=877500 RepID=A0A4Q0Y1W9_9BACT|nr:bifunctional UDP-N-acetylglucosamine diphosphorylase/glucosamine-1-phosphate N-acetyltransferase GlmU [Halarcobacter anaerophilus]QDF30218.1 fused N-acetylglucosamine-1-phosphate uridyltransferase and glucosamine-1-phosphate acetyltransferase [Halarcobacter anaerophilus]RXJ62221.1 UDP-N-acetylglucosamine diphosphorylase/glucosamine-1-phosphate N-acetyltransferase [Halarcobacter anaerophilus]
MNKKSIIILAAGQGTRMKSSLPKVLHKISGKPMLYYSIKEALKISDDITVVLYHQAQKIKEEIKQFFKEEINFVIQDHKNYPGTGGAVMGISPKYDKTLVLNADMPLIQANELEKFDLEGTIVMSVLNLKSAQGYGRVIIENENVKRVVEQKDATEEELKITTANAGVYQFDTQFLLENLPKLNNNNAQKEYYITDLVEMAITQKKVLKPIIVSEENFKGVNSKVELADAEVIHQKRIKNQFLKEGVILRLPDTIYIEEGVQIEGESIIENGVSLLGDTVIKNSHVKTNCVVEDSVLEDSDIGPMARVRPGSNLKNTHLGNFVETKKAILTGVKAGHLSYLGDCSIDEGTNVGAGCITCNYDGINKHKTIIGKNVFIGSDCQMVAPVTIEDDVMIAAGTCVTKDISKGNLAINRAPMKFIKDFYYRFFGKK